MKTNTQLLEVARKQLGNTGGKYRKYVGASGSWCDMFVFWLYDANGNGSLIPWKGSQRTYCPASIQWCKKNLAQIPLYLAMPCDIIYFDWDKNGNPNHIGIVESKVSTSVIKTIEGNTNGGKVARKNRDAKYVQAIYRPHFVPTGLKKERLAEDGSFGYKSVFMLQVALNIKADGILGLATVKALQKKAGCSQDGQFGKGTAKAVQKMVGVTADGAFGPNSVKALQKWINTKLYSNTQQPTPKPSATLKSYKIEVDLTNQICTVYGVYSDGSKKGIMSEFVSTARKGKSTPVGNFKIQGASGGRKAKYRTAKMSSGKSFAEFACRFKGAKMMHTVPYKKRQTTGHVNKAEFNKLGTVASAGCVRMPWKLAHFIYENCPVGTPVRVFKGTKGQYPMGKPTKYKATTDIDPTYKK